MRLPRRQFLHLAAAIAALPAASRLARAQSYPTRPVHLIEGFGAGSAPDIVARLIGQWLSERLGQSIIVENRSGASSSIAAEAAVRAAPDGYTLLLVTTANPINAGMFKLNFDFIRDIAPVATICRVPLVMEVHPSVPSQNRRGIHRLCQGQSRQDQSGIGRNWIVAPHGRRDVQDDGRRRPLSRAVSREHKSFRLCSLEMCRYISVRFSHR